LKKPLIAGLRDLFHEPPELLIGLHPLAHLGLQGLGDIDHLAFFSHPQGQIEAGMEFSLGAFTSGFAADAGHGDQGTDEKGFLVKELGQAGAGLAFFGRQVSAVAHKGLL
jgi:hypothetical protein